MALKRGEVCVLNKAQTPFSQHEPKNLTTDKSNKNHIMCADLSKIDGLRPILP